MPPPRHGQKGQENHRGNSECHDIESVLLKESDDQESQRRQKSNSQNNPSDGSPRSTSLRGDFVCRRRPL